MFLDNKTDSTLVRGCTRDSKYSKSTHNIIQPRRKKTRHQTLR